MFAPALIIAVVFAFANAQMPSQCQNTCVQQNARNQQLYNQMFQGSISQNDYNTVCNDINTVQSCLQQCQGQSGSNQNQGQQQFGQNGSGGNNMNNNNNNNGGFQNSQGSSSPSSSSSSSGQQQQMGSQSGNQGSDCLSVSLPIYTSACNAGYQQFSQLGQCYQRLNSGYSQAKQQCQQQCASTSNRRRRRQSATNNSLVNSNTFCLTNCGLSQQLSTIQSQCNSWVAQFAQTVSQTYNQLYQLSPSCLRM